MTNRRTTKSKEVLIGRRTGKELAIAKITELDKKYSNLKIDGIEDKKGYKEVVTALTQYTSERVLAKKIHKEMKTSIITAGKELDSVLKETLSMILSSEEILRDKRKVIDDEVSEIKKVEDLKIERKNEEAEAIECKVSYEKALKAHEEIEKIKEENVRLKKAEDARKEKEIKIANKKAKEAQDKLDTAEEENTRLKKAEDVRKGKEKKEKVAAQKRIDDEKKEKERLLYLESIKSDVQKIKEFAKSLSAIEYPKLEKKNAIVFLNEYKIKIKSIQSNIIERLAKF